MFVDDEPLWTADHALSLSRFLASPAGSALRKKIQYQIVSAMLEPDITDEQRHVIRALAGVLEGLKSSSDVAYWQSLEDKEPIQNDKSYRYFQDEETEVE